MNQIEQALQASASLRGQRSAAARLLANIPTRGEIEWDDLLAVPSWALVQDDAMLTMATMSIGAWAHLDQIRRCIDGKLLAHISGLLGQSELDRIMAADRLRDEDGELLGSLPEPLAGLDASALRQRLMYIGQWVMVLSLGRHRVRKAVAQALWPHIPHLQTERLPQDLPSTLAVAVMRARTGASAPSPREDA